MPETAAPENRTATVDVENVHTEGRTLHGFACVYGAESRDLGGFTESIEAGAFAGVLAGEPDVYLTLNHDPSKVLARTTSGTLRIREEERGVAFEADLGDGPTARDVRDMVKRGDLKGASFRFKVAPDGERWEGERRTLTRIGQLVDLSLATTPAYDGPAVELRSLPENTDTEEATVPETHPGGLRVEDRTAAPEGAETRLSATLGLEDRVADWVARRPSRSAYSSEEQRDFSLGRAIKGMVSGDWTDAELEQRALAEGAGSTGGFLTPEPLSAQVIDRIRNQAQVMMAGAQTVPMESDTLSIPRLATGIQPAWKVENAAVVESDPAFERVSFKANTLAVLVRMSFELFEDMPPSSADLITNEITQALALELDRAALRGSGTAPEPRGVRNQAGVTVQSMGTNGATPTYDALVDAVSTIQGKNLAPNAAIHTSRTAKTFSNLKDTTGQPLMMPPLLDGLSQLVSNQVPVDLTAGTSSDASEIYVGRWSDLLVGVRPSVGVRIQQLNERFADQMQIGLLAYLRADVQLARPESFVVISGVRP
jgi:HK97 family phage major capsid protein/HK97 family phage prohead protease